MKAEKLRVLLVGPVPPSLGGSAFGGVATHVAGLATHLADLNTVDVHLLASGTYCESWDRWCEKKNGYSIYRPGGPSGARPLARRLSRLRRYGMKAAWGVGRNLPQAMRLLQEYPAAERNGLRSVVSSGLLYHYILDHVQPDIVHVHDTVSDTLGWRLAVNGKVPIVATLHGISPVLEDHPERDLESVLRINLRLLSAYIAVSSLTREEAGGLGASPDRVVVIPNAIDCAEFAPLPQAEARQKLGLPDGPLVLYCGQLIPRKNIATLLDAFRALLPEFPTVHLAIVGGGPDEACLKSRAIEPGVSNRVLFAGARPHDELKWWYNACDAMVNPASSEGLSISMLEAMACGKPVVASQPPSGSYDALIDEGTGLVFKPGNMMDLVAQIRRLLLDPEFATRLGEQARRLMVQEYDWPVIAGKVLAFYGEIALSQMKESQPCPKC